MKVDVIIPVYGPGNRLLELFDRLGRQTVPVDRLIIMNTEKYLWDKWTETLEPGRLPENLSVYHVTKEEFDHGATRNAGIEHSDADVCVCMTHDALPADTGLLKAPDGRALFREGYRRGICETASRKELQYHRAPHERVQLSGQKPDKEALGSRHAWNQDVLLFQCLCGI